MVALEPKLYSTRDVARLTGTSVSNVLKLVRRGLLVPAVPARRGQSLWFTEEAVRRLLAVRQESPRVRRRLERTHPGGAEPQHPPGE